MRFDTAGNVYWVERLSATVRKWDAKTHLVTTIAGSGTPGFSGDGGPATRAQLNEPHSIGFDPSGNLYICDVRNHRIRKLDMKTGLLSTFAGTGRRGTAVDGASISQSPLDGPRALDFSSSGELWLALREGNAILQLNLRDQTITRAAGTGKKGLSGDNGPATSAALNGPKGLSIAPNGDVVFADTENHAIRSLNVRTHTLSLLAGTGRPGDGTETDPLHCALNRPHGVFVDQQGAVFIGDTDANRVRVIRP